MSNVKAGVPIVFLFKYLQKKIFQRVKFFREGGGFVFLGVWMAKLAFAKVSFHTCRLFNCQFGNLTC